MQVLRCSSGCHKLKYLEVGPRNSFFKQAPQEVFMYSLKSEDHCKWNIIYIRTLIYSHLLVPAPPPSILHFQEINIASSFEQPKKHLTAPWLSCLNTVQQPNCMNIHNGSHHAVSPGKLHNRFLAHTTVTRITNEPPPPSLQESPVLSKTTTIYLLLRAGVKRVGVCLEKCVWFAA